jgi:hypothetical protein
MPEEISYENFQNVKQIILACVFDYAHATGIFS